MDDDTITFEEEDEIVPSDKLKHPYITMFHLAFRISAIVVYMMCQLFSNSFIASFVVVVLLLSMDFWTVKNITGRLMVGLRWWNYIDDNGKSNWFVRFKNDSRILYTFAEIVQGYLVRILVDVIKQSLQISVMCPAFQGAQQYHINMAEARIFWLALILCPLLWSVLFVTALFRLNFQWLLLVCIAIILNGANLYGYVKCKMGGNQYISTATSDFFKKQIIQNVASMMTRSPPTNNPNQQTNVI
ncbi:putative Golgi apparatus membrane protein-like protein CG5021 isoform X3 [Vespula maculifrons]|uniref:Golgi apparatus membrane protein TVP23 homolog n=1 Tax=Vespula maculifrons TaxID=7453 RepID=A0ABD2BJE4_VESMC